jgi:lysophospholipase L1-like esterase
MRRRRRSRSRARRAVRIIAANIGLLIAVSVIAELIFGNWIFGPDFGFLNIRHGERHVLDISEFMPGRGSISYSRDRHGLRGDYGGDPAKIDILAIGGSTTNERFVDDSEIWTQRLADNFAAAGQSVRIANGGVDGQSSRGHIKAFELWFPNIPGLKPKMVLAYVGINDTAVTGDDASKFDAMRSPEPMRRVRHYVMNHSVFYNQFRRVRGAWRARSAKLMHGGNSFKTGLWKPVNTFIGRIGLRAKYSGRLRNYGERLVILTAAIRDFGAEPVFVTQPIGAFRSLGGSLEKLVQPGDIALNPEISDQALKTIGLFNDATRAVCAAQKLRCIDLAAEVRFQDGDFYDPLHTTPAGSQRVADFLFAALKPFGAGD